MSLRISIDPPSRLGAAGLAAAVVVIYILCKGAYNYFSSPIPRAVPGPFLANFTSKWILSAELAGTRGTTVHALHKRYGPVVKLAPNELSFSSLDCVKAIYGHGSSCLKSPIYSSFGTEGIAHIRDPERHRERAKRLGHIFSVSTLRQMEPLIQPIVTQVCSAIAQQVDKPIDALHWCRMTALDISGEILLGKSFEGLKGTPAALSYVHDVDNAMLCWGLEYLAPVPFKLLSLLPFKAVRDFLRSGDSMYEYGHNAMQEYLRTYGRNSNRPSLLTKMLAGDPLKGTEPLPDPKISIEVSNLVFAATDTTGTTMAYALYELCCNPEWQESLRSELRATKMKELGYPFQILQTLPVLNAVIQETMRVHPAALSGLPRVTTEAETKLAGLRLPANTTVSMQALTLQRDPIYFTEPDTFDPSRWLSKGELFQGTPEMREMMFVFSKGTRACLGQYMAVMELKIFVAKVIDLLEVRLEGDQTHAEMEMLDHLTLVPKGKRCGLIFSEAGGA